MSEPLSSPTPNQAVVGVQITDDDPDVVSPALAVSPPDSEPATEPVEAVTDEDDDEV